jgi:hypothetical protein
MGVKLFADKTKFWDPEHDKTVAGGKKS